jgi:hypothetical protein
MKTFRSSSSIRYLICFALACGASFCAESAFNGSWDITVPNDARHRAWWLKIEGAGAGSPKGEFVSAYAGDLNHIDEITIHDNDLTFGFNPKSKNPNASRRLVYHAHLSGDKLEGTFEGQNGETVKWIGVRAPVIRDKDDGTWREGKAISPFDGRDLSGWHTQEPEKTGGWSVKDSVLASTGHVSNLVTNQKFWNFKLHLEFKVPTGSNSGIALRARYEVQIIDDYGKPPNKHGNGALYSRILPTMNASKPPNEWQTYDIRLVGRQVTIMLNGKTIIDKGAIEGLTAIASDPNEGEPGPISLQGDHGPVEFRNILITPLEKS